MAYRTQRQKRQAAAQAKVRSKRPKYIGKQKPNPVVKKRLKAQADKLAAARKASNERAAELRSYGIDAAGGATTRPRTGPSKTFGPKIIAGTSAEDLQKGRDKALRVNQREQLRKQNQELKTLTLQRRRRSTGRAPLSSVAQRKSTLGPSGTLA